MNILEQNFNIKYSELDHNLALKPYSLLNMLQDIASDSAEELGFGYSYMSSNNYAWFLIKYRMEFENYPINILNLKLKTKPRGFNKLFAYREFEILDSDKIIGKIFSMWSVIDLKNRSPILVASAINNNPNMLPYERGEADLLFQKIKPVQNISLEKSFEVRYNDLDVNGHANNGNYIIWAFEPLSFEFKSNHKIKTLDMIFKKEAKYGDIVLSQVEFKNDKTTVHCLKNINGEDLFLLECNWI